MQLYMLDTNTASYIIKGKPTAVRKHLIEAPMGSICISSITQAELLHCVAEKAEARHLPKVIK
ncbi:VapC3: putative tRNA(fMet)-specific endonuclease [Desulfosarcina variabilis str. Montpellier]|uniref:PIN domain-containing protein n=1 Tax=Desulfosarcina variabilis TaxID=2300 RepID=UPI003AFA5815